MSYTTSKTGIAKFVERCIANGLEHVVCSPGSRNAPLIIAFDKHPQIKTHVIHDERSAAFYALGMALGLKKPVAVTCTSGSALTNYYPAVAEAYYQCVPLIILSADRPEEWVNHGDGQTIMQKEIYGRHVHSFETIEENFDENGDDSTRIDNAFSIANGNWKGPVHFNFPIEEPLYETVETTFDSIEFLPEKTQSYTFQENDLKLIKDRWVKAKKKMILCGQMNEPGRLRQLLHELAGDSSVLVLVENTANVVSSRFVHCIDRTLVAISSDEISAYQPDLLISLGGAVISKKIKTFLRNAPPEHWKVGHEFPEMDTYRCKTKSFECRPDEFIACLLDLDLPGSHSTYGNKWKQKDFQIMDSLTDFYDELEFCDLKAYEVLLDMIPEDTFLHMGNSSVVRYCQLFDPVASIKYFANRGTSGIDGSTSTAFGVALSRPDKLHVFITGDVSFFYDSNALWNTELPENMIIILINNGGGGIFRIIDGPSTSDQLQKYFEARHNFSAEFLCKAYNVAYCVVDNSLSLEREFERLLTDERKQASLMEVCTANLENERVLKRFFTYVGECFK